MLQTSEMHEIVQRFLARLDDEIAFQQDERRPGRAMSKKQEELEAAKARDSWEYEMEGLRRPSSEIYLRQACRSSGMVLPAVPAPFAVMLDLTDADSVLSGRYWMERLKGRSGYLK